MMRWTDHRVTVDIRHLVCEIEAVIVIVVERENHDIKRVDNGGTLHNQRPTRPYPRRQGPLPYRLQCSLLHGLGICPGTRNSHLYLFRSSGGPLLHELPHQCPKECWASSLLRHTRHGRMGRGELTQFGHGVVLCSKCGDHGNCSCGGWIGSEPSVRNDDASWKSYCGFAHDYHQSQCAKYVLL